MSRPRWSYLALLLAFLGLASILSARATQAAHTPDPASVTIAGSLQSELGCSGDWQPDCAATYLTYDPEDDVWQGTFTVPAGNWEYKAALNNSWDENYGLGGEQNGPNIPLNLAAETTVKFYYSHETHWITDNANSEIAVAPGNFQSELGCSGDWQPWCLRSWLQDPDGDGVFRFVTNRLAAGDYEVKVAHNESWDENYGAGGVPGGPNIPFNVPLDCQATLFEYTLSTHILTIDPAPAPPQPATVTIPGSFQSELGCSGDWQPDCANTYLTYDAEDGVWQGTFTIPAGNWEYKAALNDSWDENYGQNAQPNGPNISLVLDEETAVKFYYPHDTHWVTDNFNTRIAVAPGSFQSEMGCAGDWDPSCLRSWLQDPDGDGFFTFSTPLPAGGYEAKVAINESWDENYGAGGVPNGPNIPFTVATACEEQFFTFESATNILEIGAEGGPVGNLGLRQAHWLSADTVAWNLAAADASTLVTLHYSAGANLTLDEEGIQGADATLSLTYDPAGLPPDLQAKFPHLAGFKAFKLAPADLDQVPAFLKGQIAIGAVSPDDTPLGATGLQIPGVLDDLFTTDAALGASFDAGVPSLAVWAPTAQSVSLLLYADADPGTLPTAYPMAYDPATGVWSVTGTPDWVGQYYQYEVVVYAPTTRAIETNRVTDPYSVSLAANSTRSQLIDLDDPALMPPGWASVAKPPLVNPEDVVLYELHIRDFSWYDVSVPEDYRGTYMAFTVADSAGMGHLGALADAGLTHVHLLPSFDIATITERREDQIQPDDELLGSFPPDSDQQQAIIAATENQDGFNWGYDPYHYSVPEGSYSTNPEGPTRIFEYRAMVQALNEAGLRVVNDVVYNHTNAAGQNAPWAVLDRVVPGYYHRLNLDGGLETSSCCPNTASEHAMMEKLMIDSLLLWAKAYKVDGFRFDLMGHHMKQNMLNAQAALAGLTPAEDGVDGAAIYIYGEGWNFGEVANNARGVNATQANMAGTGIGSFNDRIRDGARGGGPFSGLQEQGFATGLYYDPNATDQGPPAQQLDRLLLESDWIRLSLAGNLADYPMVDRFGNLIYGWQLDYNGQQAGYTQDPQEIINYISAHDNETWFDAIQLKVPLGTSMADRVRVQNMGLSLVALGQGVPFFHAGSDMLRSKDMDRDSFNSGDWFNRLDFTYQTNNWGVGLPVASKNQANWPLMQPLLANPALKPLPADIQRTVDHFQEMLAIRRSSPLFRLTTEAEIVEHLFFYNTGPAQIPGLIVMSLTDPTGAVDRVTEQIVVLFNANDEPQTFADPALAGLNLALHPVQQASSDPVVGGASYAVDGTFTVPGRTTAVFVAKRPVTEQLNLVIEDVAALRADGTLNMGQANALTAKLTNAIKSLQMGKITPAMNQLNAFLNQVNAFEQSGILSPAQAAALRDAVQAALDCLAEGGPIAASSGPPLAAVPALLGVFGLAAVAGRRRRG